MLTLSYEEATLTNADYLKELVELAGQKFGPNAPATQDLREQLESAKRRAAKPPKEQRLTEGFRKL